MFDFHVISPSLLLHRLHLLTATSDSKQKKPQELREEKGPKDPPSQFSARKKVIRSVSLHHWLQFTCDILLLFSTFLHSFPAFFYSRTSLSFIQSIKYVSVEGEN